MLICGDKHQRLGGKRVAALSISDSRHYAVAAVMKINMDSLSGSIIMNKFIRKAENKGEMCQWLRGNYFCRLADG